MENTTKQLHIKSKTLNGVELTNYELAMIRMISDYLFLDRFNDVASFLRFEQCFGLLFSKNDPNFKLSEAFKEIVGEKKKYITFRRMINAFLKFKSKKSTNYSFNKFMKDLFEKIIVTKEEESVIGELTEGDKIFSTRNCRNRNVITKISVLSDETKNLLKGMVIQYDEAFDAILCNKFKKEEIMLEINMTLHDPKEKKKLFQTDRDGLSHIAGGYDEKLKIIKFLIFKCRSGKILFIGDEKEKKDDKIKYFIIGSSRCQLKSLRLELKKDQLSYLEPKFHESLRVNNNIAIEFDNIDEKYLNENQNIYEELTILDKLTPEQLKNDKIFLKPLVPDDTFVDKMRLVETIPGKDFDKMYKSYLSEEEVKPNENLQNSIVKLRNKAKGEEKKKLEDENKNLNEKNNLYKKVDFDSLLVKIIKLKQLAQSVIDDVPTDSKKKSDDKKDNEKNENKEDDQNDVEEVEDVEEFEIIDKSQILKKTKTCY